MLGRPASVFLSLVALAFLFGRWGGTTIEFWLALGLPCRRLGVWPEAAVGSAGWPQPLIHPPWRACPYPLPSLPSASCCAYLMVLGDSLHPLLAAVGGDAWWTQREVLIAIVGSAVILPLCFRRTLGALAGAARTGCCKTEPHAPSLHPAAHSPLCMLVPNPSKPRRGAAPLDPARPPPRLLHTTLPRATLTPTCSPQA